MLAHAAQQRTFAREAAFRSTFYDLQAFISDAIKKRSNLRLDRRSLHYATLRNYTGDKSFEVHYKTVF